MAAGKPRLLILGASGFVGQHLARRAGREYDVIRADQAPPGPDCDVQIDITHAAPVQGLFDAVPPRFVVLLAAISDIDRCEAEPELAQAVNVQGAIHVARACASSGARLLFTSSAAVFDGTMHGYSEDNPPTPVSVYGRTKADAEKAIAEILPSAVVLRLGLVLGFATGSGTNAMLNRTVERWRAGQPLVFPVFEKRNPIDAATLSEFILELLANSHASGVCHLGCAEPLSRYALGLRLADRLGFPRELVIAQIEPAPGRAPRGADHFLLPGRIKAFCRTPIPSCEQVIERAIHGTPQGNL